MPLMCLAKAKMAKPPANMMEPFENLKPGNLQPL